MTKVSEKIAVIEAFIRDTIEGRRPIDPAGMRDAVGAIVIAEMMTRSASFLVDEELRIRVDELIAGELDAVLARQNPSA